MAERTPSLGQRARRSKSPARMTPQTSYREKEKEDLSQNNDRLAMYIDRVRSLELEKERLEAKVENLSESSCRDSTNLKSVYEKELKEARLLLDDITNQKAGLQLRYNKLLPENKELNDKVDQLKHDLNDAQNTQKLLHKRLDDVKNDLNNALRDNQDVKDENQKLKEEINRLTDDLKHTKKELESETLRRVDAENRCLSIKEEMEFNQQIMIKEYEERVVHHGQPNGMDETDFNEEIDEYFVQQLQELRDDLAAEARNAKKDLEDTYVSKIDDLLDQCRHERENSGRHLAKLSDIRNEYDRLKCDHGTYEVKIAALESKYENLQVELAKERDERNNEVQKLFGDIDEKDEEIRDMSMAYEEIVGKNIQLSAEIKAYTKLLDGEDERLKDTPRRSRSRSRGRKRGHSEDSEESILTIATSRKIKKAASTDLLISAISEHSVSVINNGPTSMPLCGFTVKQTVDSQEPVEYKFTPKYALDAGKTVSIYDASSGKQHNPPFDIVMKGSWETGKHIKFEICNDTDEVIATWDESPKVEEKVTTRTKCSERRSSLQRISRLAGEKDNCTIS